MAQPLAGVTALYGGSFDPPHVGHQMACLYLLEALGAQEVVVVPTSSHAFGKRLAPFAHRLAMVRAMAAPLGPRMRVEAIEEELGGTSTTHATVCALEKRYPGRRWGVVVGADLLADLPKWAEAEALFARAGLIALGRGGVRPPQNVDFPPRPWLAEPVLDLPQVASSTLREQMRTRDALTGLVPCGVLDYIEAHALYAGDVAQG